MKEKGKKDGRDEKGYTCCTMFPSFSFGPTGSNLGLCRAKDIGSQLGLQLISKGHGGLTV